MSRRCFACGLTTTASGNWYLNRNVRTGKPLKNQILCQICLDIIFRYKYHTKTERHEAYRRGRLGKAPINKGIKLKHKRRCFACGSKTTYTSPKTGKSNWVLNRNGDGKIINVLCNTCNLRYFFNPSKKGKLFHITFKDKQIKLDYNPKTGFCSLCGKVISRTQMHHIEYDETDPLANTVELCESCHGRDSASRRYQKKPLIT